MGNHLLCPLLASAVVLSLGSWVGYYGGVFFYWGFNMIIVGEDQPFRMNELVIIDANGGCPCRQCCRGTEFRDVYGLFFQANQESASASWSDLKAWLDKRGWKLRAKEQHVSRR